MIPYYRPGPMPCILRHHREYFEKQNCVFFILNTNVLAHYFVDSKQGIVIEWEILLNLATTIGGRYFYIFEHLIRGQIMYLCKVTQIINGKSQDYTRFTHTFYTTVLPLPGDGWNASALLTWGMCKLTATPFKWPMKWPNLHNSLQRQLILVTVSSHKRCRSATSWVNRSFFLK